MSTANRRVDAAFLEQFAEAWNRHDIDALMSFMADDCVFHAAAGPDLRGRSFDQVAGEIAELQAIRRRAELPPLIVAIPPTISASSSERVMRGTYGFTISGASVCPMNTLATAESDSAPLVPIIYIIALAITRTMSCRMPK